MPLSNKLPSFVNSNIQKLHPYPFERLRKLTSSHSTKSNHQHVSLALGEPKHQAPEWIVDELADRSGLRSSLGTYPITRGTDELREAISAWIQRRYRVSIDPETQVLPVNGTREGLFSFGQATLSGADGTRTVLPNPFYQIYEGSCLLAESNPFFMSSTVKPDFDTVPQHVWEQAELLFLCTPNNPSGAVLQFEELKRAIELAHLHDFVIASDECYSEIYLDEDSPPCGILQAAQELGLTDYRKCVAFNSLSKRSNVPGLRSGFVAGDASLISMFLKYRTYHGCAMPMHIQNASLRLWQDEEHVTENRGCYRKKVEEVHPILNAQFGCTKPEGAFYYWPELGMDDEQFTSELFVRQNITVLPGSYLARAMNGHNPGMGRVRIALVAPMHECIDAVKRLCETHAVLMS